MKFWAHSDPNGLPADSPSAHWQPLAEHLAHVSALAKHLAQNAAPLNTQFHQAAEFAGLLHDYGKYTGCFQEMIRGNLRKRCPHAIHGAAMAFTHARAPHIAAAIAAHHAGLPDPIELFERVNTAASESASLLAQAAIDCPAIATLLHTPPTKFENPAAGRFDLVTRMLLSCLVDADRLDTASRPLIQAPLQAAQRLETLLAHLADLTEKSLEGAVKTARSQVLANCLQAASYPENIFSLSVPTGGGKTLSAMAFALKRAALSPDRFRRIIVVIPYLSIIEQNAEVYARVFGADSILEHHSGASIPLRPVNESQFEPVASPDNQYTPPSRRPETENWDAPLIVTTSVRFFESLFSNHPSDLRRVHNIARSIVILDEVQVLPRHLLGPLLQMMDELSRDWGCSFVLSTATKPAFERPPGAPSQDRRWPPGKVREIIAAPQELHHSLQRVSIDWRIKQPVDWPEVAAWIANEPQALCVVNLRDHASQLFDHLAAIVKDDSLFHLSTRMCAAHRLAVITQIRSRLSNKLPCRVISTQLIEAGVDLDFPIAFRALGPLDSIFQVAGRADREGILTALLGRPGGRLIVFKPLDHRTPPNEYEHATGLTETLAQVQDIQPNDLAAMSKFFEDYYGYADLGEELLKFRNEFKFRSLAGKFEMISSRMQDIFVPYDAGRALIDELYKRKQLTADLRRQLQRFTVGLQPWEFQAAKQKHGILSELTSDSNVWIANDAAYHRVKGLQASLNSAQLIF